VTGAPERVAHAGQQIGALAHQVGRNRIARFCRRANLPVAPSERGAGTNTYAYVIRDGHHSVSVAKARGALTINAIVDAG
jgi:hypothetical protein